MSARTVQVIVAMAVAASLAPGIARAQDPQTQGATRTPQRGQRPGGPGSVTPADQLQMQRLLDAWALVQAKEQLRLTDEQYPGFVARLTKLHDTRRRTAMERRRLMGELRLLLNQTPVAKDETLTTKIRELDELTKRGADEAHQATLAIDGVLSPWQRGRYRMFEDLVERRKIEMLRSISAGRGGTAAGK
jgi:hypothetical protein